jgi:hypothetical protein
MTTIATASIAAQNTFSTAVQLEGYFNVSISGTFSATVTVQRSIDNNTWMDVNTYTAAFEGVGFDPEFMWYRVGVKTGQYTSGTVVVRIGREDKDRH